MIAEWLKDTRHKIIVMMAVIFLIGGAIGKHFLIDPDMKASKDLAAQIKEEIKKEETLKRLLSIDVKIKGYDKFAAKTDDASWLIQIVNASAKESGVALVSMAPQQVETGENFSKLVLRVEARCSYHELGKFVSRIESDSHFIKIADLNAQSQDRTRLQGSGNKLSVLISLVAYYPKQGALT